MRSSFQPYNSLHDRKRQVPFVGGQPSLIHAGGKEGTPQDQACDVSPRATVSQEVVTCNETIGIKHQPSYSPSSAAVLSKPQASRLGTLKPSTGQADQELMNKSSIPGGNSGLPGSGGLAAPTPPLFLGKPSMHASSDDTLVRSLAAPSEQRQNTDPAGSSLPTGLGSGNGGSGQTESNPVLAGTGSSQLPSTQFAGIPIPGTWMSPKVALQHLQAAAAMQGMSVQQLPFVAPPPPQLLMGEKFSLHLLCA